MMKSEPVKKKGIYLYFTLIGALFLFCCLTGYDLARRAGNGTFGNVRWTWGYTLRTVMVSLAVGGALGIFLCKGIDLMIQRGSGVTARDTAGRPEKGSFAFLFPLSMLLIVLAYLPAFLAYYPAICAYDFPAQTAQIFLREYVDHHPIAHTLLLRGFLYVGKSLWGSINGGVALFAAAQLLFLAAVFGLGITLLWRKGVKKVWIFGMQLWAMLYPFHWYMSISITKDVIFSGFFLLFVYAFMTELSDRRLAWKWNHTDFGLLVAIIGVILFRNNGKYALLVLLAVLGLVLWRGKENRKLWGRLLLVCLAAFLAGNLMLSGLFRATEARQGDRREMLSVPMQQLARCMLYHGGVGILTEDDGTMDPQDAQMIEKFMPDAAYQYYQPDFADPVKRHVNTSAALNEAGQFIKTYLHLMVQYPGDYLNAVLALDAGYLYPEDVSHAVVNQVDYAPGKGYVQTRWAENEITDYGFYKASKWESLHVWLEQWAEENAYLRIPVLKYLFVPGVFLWAYLVLAGVWMLQGRSRMCISLALVLGYYATLLLGPVVQLRYLYPLMISFPYFALLGSCRESGKRV